MKFTNPLRKQFDCSAEIKALNQRFDAAAGTADTTERLLRLQAIALEADELVTRQYGRRTPWVWPVLMGGGAAGMTGAAIVAFPLMIAGTATMVSAIALQSALGAKSIRALSRLRQKCTQAQEDTIRDADMGAVAQSPDFHAVMETFPALKEKFLLAVEREKMLPPAPPLPAPNPKGGLSL